MSWVAVGGAAVGVVGSVLNKGKGGSGTTQQNVIDPDLKQYLYGGNGLLNGANNTYQQQAAQGGLNPLQNAGLETQRQVLTSPQYTQGYDSMRSLGQGLLSQGVAGNPFTNAATARPAPYSSGLLSNATLAPAFQPIQQSQAAPGVTPLNNDEYMAQIRQFMQQQLQQQLQENQNNQMNYVNDSTGG